MSPLLVISVFLHLASSVPTRSPMIVGGEKVKIENFSYMGKLRKFGYHQCGASVISEKFAVTAAHCYTGWSIEYYELAVASSFLYWEGDIYPLSEFNLHPKYDYKTLNNDVAVLKVKGVIIFKETVKPIQFVTEEPLAGANATVTGWGYLWEGGPIADELQAVTVPIIEHSVCKELYESTKAVTTLMICAGLSEGTKDACQGDSGGPLTVGGLLAGIVSWGRGCARAGFPGVYSNVAQLRVWIDEATKQDISP